MYFRIFLCRRKAVFLIAKGQSKDAVDKVYLDATKYYERYLDLFPEEHGIRNDLALLLITRHS